MPESKPSTTHTQRVLVGTLKMPKRVQQLRDIGRLLEEVENDRQRNYAVCDSLVENLRLVDGVNELRLAEVLIDRIRCRDYMRQVEEKLREALQDEGWPADSYPLCEPDRPL